MERLYKGFRLMNLLNRTVLIRYTLIYIDYFKKLPDFVLLKKLQRTLPTGYKVCVDEALTKSGKKSV
ncbi:hypothetical protein PN456_16255 [Nodularia spumigena CS-586/05]|uniref:hypothetical protein n=1 Tax=Nodularia spumigena TaxID=70799 RepID=UPI00232A854F|nr:hypothetical protein [Nodularia spumigena]MDB9343658.1 hypothetical protein [Nodularia spumigena CS-588/06]MDB9370485.1 hypothetical protein [Nodularia spumigena CS-586/05]